MTFKDFMAKVRQWDNRSAHWITRHFYILFFELVLVVIFLFTFVNIIRVIDTGFSVAKDSVIEKLMYTQSVNIILLVILLLLNSFWMLYIFNSMLKIRGILRNIDYSLSRRKYDRREDVD